MFTDLPDQDDSSNSDENEVDSKNKEAKDEDEDHDELKGVETPLDMLLKSSPTEQK